MNSWELVAMILYLILVIGVGVYFFFKGGKNAGEKDYFLGGRKMGGWVAALSAGASDMSAWVLMGLPGAFYLYGMGQVWISVGLFIGTVCSWVFVAPRLRRYSIRANDSITIPQFLTNRFLSKNKALQIVSAIVFVVVYCIYSASSIDACGTLFNTVVGMDKNIAMVLATCVIVVYTFLGGFNAVCWTDFFQGMLMLGALMLAPIIAVFTINAPEFIAPANFYNVLSTGSADWVSISTIISGLGWGLGYFGMPHIVVRYISIKSEHEMKKSRIIGSVWTGIILTLATIVGIVGRKYALDGGANGDLVFINMVR
ncbi:MAG: sodium/proline symporter, partial [Clostridia bacterium]|nr:sodium/proline symporter [Clostridia bacterium]